MMLWLWLWLCFRLSYELCKSCFAIVDRCCTVISAWLTTQRYGFMRGCILGSNEIDTKVKASSVRQMLLLWAVLMRDNIYAQEMKNASSWNY